MKFSSLVNDELNAMKKNFKEKNISVEEFFGKPHIQASGKLLDSHYSNSLREKIHSQYLNFNDQKMKGSLAKKKFLLMGGSFLSIVFVIGALIILTVPSVREQVSSTAANLFGKGEKKNEQNVDGPEKVENDTQGPDLVITSPTDGSSTSEAKITVKGATETSAKVFVGDNEVENIEGEFSKEVDLVAGNNDIKIKAIDEAGNESSKTIVVIKNVVTAPTPPASTSKISLSGSATDTGIKLTWSVSGIDTSQGFKLLKSTSTNPTYPGSAYKLLGGSDRSFSLSVEDGKTYYLRLCQYTGDGCAVYSNTVKVTAPTNTDGQGGVSGITLVAGTGGNVSWSVNGDASNGFKLVWSTSALPTYPGSSASYYESNKTAGTINGTSGTMYYVRICEYTGSGCGLYSNQITITLP